MKTSTLAVLPAILFALAVGPAAAGSTAAESSHQKVRAEFAKARAAGGYGPFFAARPRAVAEKPPAEKAVRATQTRLASGN